MSSSMDKKDPLLVHHKPSLRQELAVVNFIQKQPLLVQSKQLKIQNRAKVYKLWIEMAKELNSIEGVEKSPTGWLKYWVDKRRYVSVKHKRIQSGKPNLKLSPLEKKILKLCLDEKKNYIEQINHELTDDHEVTQHKENDYDENYEENCSSEYNGTKQNDSCDENDMKNMIKVMVNVMEKQSTAFTQMAQTWHTQSSALEKLADASYQQANALNRLANSIESIGETLSDMKSAAVNIEDVIRRSYLPEEQCQTYIVSDVITL